jgi:diaminohydroxyphosphoribosylaminopyrimidine deaminase/5-amino-6-(5-phosphoribosylamino)uracil reductase
MALVDPDAAFMDLALRLARKGAATVSPNPAVGAVVVAGGMAGGMAGTGWHRRPGEDHAEVIALREAGDAARGATLYVTLEPCTHHGRTPPCVDAVLGAGVGRVVVAMADPDPRVAGRGIAALRAAGVSVEVGLRGKEAELLNEAYGLHRRLGRPFVTYKAAATLDGATAALDGSSQWITGPAARRDVHRLRAASDAVCVGVGTVLADNPSLTVRGVASSRRPLRVVVDTFGRTPPEAQVLSPGTPTVVAVTDAAPAAARATLEEAGAEVLCLPAEGGRVSLPALLGALGARPVASLLLEGGPTLAASFVTAGLVGRYLVYLAPALMGEGTPGILQGWGAAGIGDARRLALRSVRRIGEDLRVEATAAATQATNEEVR